MHCSGVGEQAEGSENSLPKVFRPNPTKQHPPFGITQGGGGGGDNQSCE